MFFFVSILVLSVRVLFDFCCLWFNILGPAVTFFVVACTCNPATLEIEFRNVVGSIPVGGNSPLLGWWIV